MNRLIPVFRLPQTGEERREAEVLKRHSGETPLIILSHEDFLQLKKSFDEPSKHHARKAPALKSKGMLLFALPAQPGPTRRHDDCPRY